MTRNRVYFGILILALVIIIIWTSYSMLNVGKSDEVYSVSVIVNDSNNERWISLRQGLGQAAKDYNIDLNFVSTGEFASAEEEMALIRREEENGAEGIIVRMVSGEEEPEKMAELSARLSVILLESDVNPEGVFAYAGPDNTGIGKAIADTLRQEIGEELEGKKIGILCGNQKQLCMQQRLQGLEEGLAEEAVDILWTLESLEGWSKDGGKLAYMEQADIVVALGNDETEMLADYWQSQENGMEEHLLYGVGCSQKAVYYLDKGIIKSLVVLNEFNMGYQSMEAMANQLRYHLTKAEDSQVEYLVVNRENLYEKDNQKVLFPIVQ